MELVITEKKKEEKDEEEEEPARERERRVTFESFCDPCVSHSWPSAAAAKGGGGVEARAGAGAVRPSRVNRSIRSLGAALDIGKAARVAYVSRPPPPASESLRSPSKAAASASAAAASGLSSASTAMLISRMWPSGGRPQRLSMSGGIGFGLSSRIARRT